MAFDESSNFLNDVLTLSRDGKDLEAMHLLVTNLRLQRMNRPDEWPSFIEIVRNHDVMKLTQMCQFTSRSFNKPRGYAGDAVMLDDMYGLSKEFPHPATQNGRIYCYTTNAPAPWAVRERRILLARLIDETAERINGGRVLALACGHARELELSSAYNDGRLQEYRALDQDKDSLEVIRRDYSKPFVFTQHENIRNVISGRTTFQDFDLVYAAGLFDYLSQPIARRLVSKMYASLRPGGRMLVPNFMPDVPDIGYMEACMDWWLIYRNEMELQDVFSELPEAAREQVQIFTDSKKNIVYGLLTRPA